MTEESFSTTSHLLVAMTTTETDEIQSTGAPDVPLSSSLGVDFYFQCAVVIIGAVGTATNGLVLYAMIASNQHKKQLLIFNQNLFDFCSSVLLVVTYTVKLRNIHLTGVLGYWLCMILLSENLLWCSMNGSIINLLSVTVERYLKVVHDIWSKKVLRRKWVKISAVLFAWISGIVYNTALLFPTSDVVDGICYAYVFWESRVAQLAHGIWNFASFFVVVLFIFVFCYGRILIVIRRQARVMTGHSGPGSSAAQTQSQKIQSNVIKTMISVSAFYVITWMPCILYYLILNINSNLTLINNTSVLTKFTISSQYYQFRGLRNYYCYFSHVKKLLID